MSFMEVKNCKALQELLDRLGDSLAENHVPEDGVFDSKLVASELVGNVFRHSDGWASLEWKIDGDFVELIVRSSAQFVPPEISRPADVYAESGRGLFLVDSVSEERCTVDGGIQVKIRIK